MGIKTIRTHHDGGHAPYVKREVVLNIEHIAMYERCGVLWWATEEQYDKDIAKCKHVKRSVDEYDYAKEGTRVHLVTGRSLVVHQVFESFDRTFMSMSYS